MISDNNHLVIMAGGIGSRFWPMSTQECPKQFIDVMGCGRTLIQLTVDRFEGVCPKENIWVVTSDKYAGIVHEQLPGISESNILKEPCRRNTAPCIAYVCWKIKARNPKANIVVTPSDHVVTNVKEFQRVITSALDYTQNSDAILTLGMKPTRPETGYGYIEADLSSASTSNNEIYRVDSFKEKPDVETAERYIRQNNYYWNAGIFIWNVNTIVNAFRIYQPEIAEIFTNLMPHFYTPSEQQEIDTHFPECPNISVDYAILEKSDEIYVFPADFGWSDLGTWGSLHVQMSKDLAGNVCIGQDINMYESHDCIVHTMQEKKVVIIGLNGYIVAENNEQLLICKFEDEQRIKKFSDQ
ncbi:MAG: mannose-1-phosphate guanylyltransferase [Bacteroidaceae bacterium]|nr:mannose-1-phosphate guanylyltransferase [Bacteroidaceae bacterium]